MTPSLFILHGNGTLLNRGCEAIFRSTVALLRGEFGPCHLINAPTGRDPPEIIPSDDPHMTHVYRPRLERWTFAWAMYHLRRRLPGITSEPFEEYLPRADAVLGLGGDTYSLDYGSPRDLFRVNDITLKAGKPIVLWGASVGPFSGDPEFEKWVVQKLKRVTLICARESETVAYLAGLGVSENVRLVADPAFVLEPEPVDLDQDGLTFLSEPCVGLNLSPMMQKHWHRETPWLEYATRCVKAVADAVDLPIVLVPHVLTPTAINDDVAFMSKIADQLPELDSRLFVVRRPYTAGQLKWLIARLECFAGARTHSTIAALSSCVPTFSIGYSMKSRGINKDVFGHDHWLLSLDGLRAEALAERMVQLREAGSEIRDHLRRTMPNYRDRARQATKYLKQVVGAG